MKNQYIDDKFVHLVSDISKMRKRHRQYISYSNEEGALEVSKEILFNAVDECKNPRSPANKIHIEFDERTGFITIADNGRGIPTNLLEEIFTSLNMGSNIDTTDKADLNMDNLGLNGVGTLAACALSERVEITSYRGGTEDKYKRLVFEEGKKISEKDGKCSKDKHGMTIIYKPSKVMGKNTHIVWKDFRRELSNLQYLNKKKIKIDSLYIDKNGNQSTDRYDTTQFVNILDRNNKDDIISHRINILVDSDSVVEELHGENIKRYISMDIAFVYTSSLSPYIDSFSNSNNTVDNGDHLDGAVEALCRFLQSAAKNSMGDREKDKLDIKWDDIKSGLSIAVALRTNYENLYTGQTKHKIVSPELRKIIVDLVTTALNEYFDKNTSQLKDLITIVKTNARARREGEKVKSAVIKSSMTNWSSYKMKNFDPCTNKGKAYKEIFICEGDEPSPHVHFSGLRHCSCVAYKLLEL